MKNKIIKNFTWWFGVIFMGVILGMSLQFTRAWTNPPSPPPVDNLGAPINTSLNTQYKSGALGIGGILKTYSNLYVDGKVGMGTNNPGHEIHILASAEPQIYLESTGDGTGAALRLDDGNGSDWKIKVDGGNQNFKIRDHANKSDVFTIEDGTGRVGVGTTSPTEKLDVQGNIKASGTVCDSNGCIGDEGSDDYIGNLGNHTAGGDLDMNGSAIRGAKGVLTDCKYTYVNNVTQFSCGSGQIMVMGACGSVSGSYENFVGTQRVDCVNPTGGSKTSYIRAVCCKLN
jgi:hypothetical protein